MNRVYKHFVADPACIFPLGIKVLILAFVFLLLNPPSYSFAETYFGVGFGISFPGDTDSVFDGSVSTITREGLDTDSSFAYGVKVGHYFKSVPWLGVEFNAYRRNPDIGLQNVNQVTTNKTTGVQTIQNRDLEFEVDNLTTLGFLVMLRPPKSFQEEVLGGFEPYLGAGIGLNFLKVDRLNIINPSLTNNFEDSTEIDVGLLISGGVSYPVWANVKIFGELKYTESKFEFITLTFPGTNTFEVNDLAVMFGAVYYFDIN